MNDHTYALLYFMVGGLVSVSALGAELAWWTIHPWTLAVVGVGFMVAAYQTVDDSETYD